MTQENWHRNWKNKGIQPGPGKDGNDGPFYWITLVDGTLCGLSADDMYALKDQGKLNEAGILEHEEKIKAKL
jgi:hypothetical protein